MTKEEYEAALARIEALIDSQLSKGTPGGYELENLLIPMEEHERERLEIWSRITKEPLFQFLKHDPMGRTILCLYANGDISLGKAAQAITEKFCLGLEPTLPQWNGYTAETPATSDCADHLLIRKADNEETELNELRNLWNLRWAADRRAIKKWQEAHPATNFVLPDHADLCVWLMEQLYDKT